MRAAVNRAYGAPDVVRVEEVPAPAPGEHHVELVLDGAPTAEARFTVPGTRKAE